MTAGAANAPAYAGFWIRVFASLVDSILIACVTAPIMRLVYGPAFFAAEGPLIMGPAHVLVVYVLPAVAVVVFWIYRQATPGKMMLGMRVVDARTGGRPGNGQLVIRYLGYFVSSFPLGLGLVWVAFDQRKQGWHDKLAKTLVIRPQAGGIQADDESDHGQLQQSERWQA